MTSHALNGLAGSRRTQQRAAGGRYDLHMKVGYNVISEIRLRQWMCIIYLKNNPAKLHTDPT